MPNFTGYVIFCEDVRSEVNRQISYIGVYPFNREFFEPDEDGEFVLPKFGIGLYLQLDPEYEGMSPHITILSIDKDGTETQIAEDTMSTIPASKDGKQILGVTHLQLEGLVAPVGTTFGVDVKIGEEISRLGLFQTFGREKREA